jgi:hypothetical protein
MKATIPKGHSRISRDARVTRVVNLKMLGLTDAQIITIMEDEGYKHVSTQTISRLLNSVNTLAIRDELLRRQLRDIVQVSKLMQQQKSSHSREEPGSPLRRQDDRVQGRWG